MNVGYTTIMFSKYKKFIEKYISQNLIEWSLFKSKLRVEEFKKGEVILHIGDICDKLYFMDSGLARAYIISEEGKDYTWSIFFNDKNAQMTNLFVVDYYNGSICQDHRKIFFIPPIYDTIGNTISFLDSKLFIA